MPDTIQKQQKRREELRRKHQREGLTSEEHSELVDLNSALAFEDEKDAEQAEETFFHS